VQEYAGRTDEIIDWSSEEHVVASFLATKLMATDVGTSAKKKTKAAPSKAITDPFSAVDKRFQAQKISGQIKKSGVKKSRDCRQFDNLKLTAEQALCIY